MIAWILEMYLDEFMYKSKKTFTWQLSSSCHIQRIDEQVYQPVASIYARVRGMWHLLKTDKCFIVSKTKYLFELFRYYYRAITFYC